MRSGTKLAVAGLLVGLVCLALPAQKAVTAMRLDGRRVGLLSPGAKAAVLFFVATDCPISNGYQPEMARLQREFQALGAEFWFVYPNLTETVAGIRAHRAEFASLERGGHVLLDPGLALVKLTGADVTPEAAILSWAGGRPRVVYTGRIDDRYLSIGNERPQAGRHDLEDAIAASLAGRPVPLPGGHPVGCGIVTVR